MFRPTLRSKSTLSRLLRCTPHFGDGSGATFFAASLEVGSYADCRHGQRPAKQSKRAIRVVMALEQMHNHSMCQIEACIDLALDQLGV